MLFLPFPSGRDFLPVENRRTPGDFLAFCSSYLPRLRQRPDYREHRLASCCEVEFDLQHPERVPSGFPGKLVDDLLKGL